MSRWVSRCLVVVVAVVAGGGAGAAPAIDPEAAAVEHLNRGHTLYTSGDLAGALIEFGRAKDLVPGKATPYRWLGMTHAALGRCAEAIADVDVFIQRAQAGDPRRVEMNTLRERCTEELAPRVGTLVVESRPDGVDVHLDDETQPALGTTPCRREDVPVGVHVVFLRKGGYEAARREVTVGRRETVRLEVELHPLAPPPTTTTIALATAPAAKAPPRPRRGWPVWVGVAAGVVTAALVAVVAVLSVPPTETVFRRTVAEEIR